jgi:hypothetical protein
MSAEMQAELRQFVLSQQLPPGTWLMQPPQAQAQAAAQLEPQPGEGEGQAAENAAANAAELGDANAQPAAVGAAPLAQAPPAAVPQAAAAAVPPAPPAVQLVPEANVSKGFFGWLWNFLCENRTTILFVISVSAGVIHVVSRLVVSLQMHNK